jgi:L-amino acid N-acyltransferase
VTIAVRDADERDLPAILDLVNVAIRDTTAVYRDEPLTLENRSRWWQARRERGFPVLVADDGGAAVGVASYGDFRDSMALPGYRFTVEHSVHVARSHWGRGVGRVLVEALLERASAAGLHVMVGVIDGENEASLRFHQQLGFVETGRMPGVGRKFDRWLDMVLVQREIAS